MIKIKKKLIKKNIFEWFSRTETCSLSNVNEPFCLSGEFNRFGNPKKNSTDENHRFQK